MTTNQPQTNPSTGPYYTNSAYPSASSSEHENSWQSNFPRLPVLILSIVQFIFTGLIFILEIASLAVAVGYRPTGVGIWCAIPFSIASILTFILTQRKNCSRVWSTRVLIVQLILLLFTFILIGITGNYVQNGGYSYSIFNYYTYTDTTIFGGSYQAKLRIIQAQLALAILLMFSGFTYIGIYIYVTFVALWKPYNTLDTDHLFQE